MFPYGKFFLHFFKKAASEGNCTGTSELLYEETPSIFFLKFFPGCSKAPPPSAHSHIQGETNTALHGEGRDVHYLGNGSGATAMGKGMATKLPTFPDMFKSLVILQ